KRLPAGPGTSPNILGLGYSPDFSDRDANGQRKRVFPSKYTEAPSNDRSVYTKQIEDEFELAAQARYLFVSAGVNAQANKRYMVLCAYNIKKVVMLDDEGQPETSAAYVAQAIHYGWALYMVIEGDQRKFTAELAASIQRAGGELSTVVKKNSLTTSFHAIGLSTKPDTSFGLVSSVDEIEKNYVVSAESYPVFVEYRALRDVSSKVLDWDSPKLVPGPYTLSTVSIEVMGTKHDGRQWDGLGDPPDPLVSIFVMQPGEKAWTPLGTHFAKNSYQAVFPLRQRIAITQGTKLRISVWDKDLLENDPIGDAEADGLLAVPGALPGREFQLPKVGKSNQLNFVNIRLETAQ
ncbi:MAG: hypothetical protein FJ100_20140, partial [Deltaproteobacteria bacterium]|nr:hypothetical protein [Deltaproteobacteria bacterium]